MRPTGSPRSWGPDVACLAALCRGLGLLGVDTGGALEWTARGIELGRAHDFDWALGSP